jgi:serine/threonine protein kinase/WD40 repeat protein
MAQLKNPLVERAIALGLLGAADLERGRAELGAESDDARLLEWLVKQGLLTKWQAAQLEAGRTQNLNLAHYRLLAPLGAGGMGSVYRAFDPKLNRQVALKVLPPRQATPEAISRFQREAFVALQMRHDNVVTSFELAQHGTVHFLVMELVDGRSLSAHLAKQRRLSVRETARIGYDVALALEHAHGQGIIHRDIKPSNILLSREGHVKVADMGLAKFFGPQSQSGGPETRTGQFMGTIDYCSPEQAIDAKRADIRSDIYSLGCTLYHCLTGEAPFAEGTEVQRIMAHIESLPVAIRSKNRDVPSGFAELIEKRMLAKDPGDRFQTPAEAAEALAPWVKGEGPPASHWGGLEGLDGLLGIAEQPPGVASPAVPQFHRDTERWRARLTSRARKPRRGTKAKLVWRSIGWAALVLVMLAAAVGASLWWPRPNADDTVEVANVNRGFVKGSSEARKPNNGTTDRGDEPAKPPDGDGPAKPPDGDGTDGPSDNGENDVSPPIVDPSSGAGTDTAEKLSREPLPPTDSTGGTTPPDKPPLGEEPKVPGLLLTIRHGRSVTAVATSADGTKLLSGASDGTVRLWNTSDGSPHGAVIENPRGVTDLSISGNGRYVITGIDGDISYLHGVGGGNTVLKGEPGFPQHVLWELSEDGEAAKSRLTAVPGPLAFGLDGNKLLGVQAITTVLADGQTALSGFQCERFDLPNLTSRGVTPLAYGDGVVFDCYPAAVSTDLRLLATGGNQAGTLMIPELSFWDTKTGKPLGRPVQFQDYVAQRIALRPDGKVIAIAHGGPTRSPQARPPGRSIGARASPVPMAARDEPTLRLLHVPNARSLCTIDMSAAMINVAFNRRGDLLVCLLASGTLELRDAESGKLRGPHIPISGATAAAFSSDGKRLFVGKSDGTAELWELDALLMPAQKQSKQRAQVADVLLRNPGFESALEDWLIDIHGAKSEVELDRRVKHRGKSSLRISSTAPSDTALGQEVKLQPGQHYQLTGWVRTRNLDPKGSSAFGTLQVQNAGGRGTIAGGDNHQGDNDWTQVSLSFQSPPSGSVRICVFFVGFGEGTGTAWFDDLQLDAIDLAKASQIPESSPSAAGVDDWLWLYGKNDFTASRNFPKEIVKRISELRAKDAEIKCVAFSAHGCVVLYNQNDYFSSNIPPAAEAALRAHRTGRATLKQIAFTPDDGWIVLWNYNGFTYENVPPGLSDAVRDLAEKKKVELKWVASAPGGGWAVLYDKNGFVQQGIPHGAVARMDVQRAIGDDFKSIAFTATGDWLMVVKTNGLFSSFEGKAKTAIHKPLGLRDSNGNEVQLKSISFLPPSMSAMAWPPFDSPRVNGPRAKTPERHLQHIDSRTGRVPDALEAEELRLLTVSAGKTSVQEMRTFVKDKWSGGKQLYWQGGNPGATLELELPVEKEGNYLMSAALTMAKDYGAVEVRLDGEPLGVPIDLFNKSEVVTTGAIPFGERRLTSGNHRLTLEIVGANPATTKDYMVGVDYVRLKQK